MNQKTKTEKSDYSIEYAHIYANEHFGKEHIKSIEKLREITNKLKNANKTFVSTILIDEYNPTRHGLNVKKFLAQIKKFGANPDFVAFESKLVFYKNLLLKEVKGKIKREHKNYIEKHGKIPCSFLIAIWYLKRLGIIETRSEELLQLTDNKPFAAEEIITILPEKYRDVETRTLEIIRATRFKKCLKHISTIFFN